MLDREEYIEQAYLFRSLAERITAGIAAQEALAAIGQEVLATSKLPMAIDYLVGELKLVGTLSTAMDRMPHYFTAFQTFIMRQAEAEAGRFDIRTALAILEREAAYRGEAAPPQGLFFYRFECLSRNRLDYDHGLAAVAADDAFDAAWKTWIQMVSRQVGLIDLADLVFVRSPEYWRLEKRDALLGASSLCGACTDACPVRIDIHHHLLQNRRNAARTSPSWLERLGHRAFVFVARRPWLFAAGGWLFRKSLPLAKAVKPPPLSAWLATRDLPPAPRESFRAAWQRRRR
jgi:hypothetical protein